ncbi:nucleoside triphosphate pyrophosphohydrolase family protein [Streptacidiphilus fuscans]|uniref:Nucleotide pyrophosphohydrolase n=1 Tax=Streptacidiphilus fuscans TaxID=2789292 RepID=A0A931FEJ9_9ACTN|nr:hypothetical protein [Streptacidiphilus fuscans]MBF9071852.1 hypothetical protein [Streptacidiphilus fuscans]
MTEHPTTSRSRAGTQSPVREGSTSDWATMQASAIMVRQLYDQLNQQRLRRSWDLGDFALGFVGDVGDLAKLLMAHQGQRTDLVVDEEKIVHELSDCLFSLIVIAHETGIPLGDRFTADMTALSTRVRDMLATGNSDPDTHTRPGVEKPDPAPDTST